MMRTAGDLDLRKRSLPWALLSLNRILKGRYLKYRPFCVISLLSHEYRKALIINEYLFLNSLFLASLAVQQQA